MSFEKLTPKDIKEAAEIAGVSVDQAAVLHTDMVERIPEAKRIVQEFADGSCSPASKTTPICYAIGQYIKQEGWPPEAIEANYTALMAGYYNPAQEKK